MNANDYIELMLSGKLKNYVLKGMGEFWHGKFWKILKHSN
jgi:hypothetical protein